MSESILKPAEIKLVLKSKGLNYKLKDRNVDDSNKNCLTFIDAYSGTQLSGKIVRTFNEGEVYHWPLLNHINLAPLIEVLYIRDDLSIFITTDEQITLKEILHDEDFMYDTRCFERKRLYAKDIFSGLSYLHAKSLCLMNLTDDNIAVSKIYDKAVITDFSCLTCSRRTTRSKMAVPEIYKAPESEKGEFDAIAAEMWAGGTLMLDMFLTHMVPWAVVDYKPKKVMKIVDKLNLELLQAANTGSIVTLLDLVKYKAFLKCFFKQNPLARITARHASIASFLQQNHYDSTLRLEPTGKNVSPDTKSIIRNIKTEHFTSSGFPDNSNFQDISINFSNIGRNDSQFYEDSVVYYKEPATSKCTSDSEISVTCSSEINVKESPMEREDTVAPMLGSQQNKEEKFGEIRGEVSACHSTTSVNICKQDDGDQLIKSPSPFFYGSRHSLAASQANIELDRTNKSYQTLQNGNNTFDDTNYNGYESSTSKSLSLKKLQSDEDSTSFKFCSRKTLSNSNTRSVSTKQSNPSDLWNSDLCLDHLFEEGHLRVNKTIKDKYNTNEVLRARRVRRSTESNENYLSNRTAYAPVADSCKELTDKSVGICRIDVNKSGVLDESALVEIRNKITFLKNCQIDLLKHSRCFISEDFNDKQRKLLNGYQNLLRQEFFRLRKVKERYELKLGDLMRLRRSESSVSNKFDNCHGILPPYEKDISYRVCQGKVLETEKMKGNLKRRVTNTKNCVASNTNITPKIRLRRRYSYYRAVEISGRNADKIWKLGEANKKREQQKPIFTQEYTSEDKLIQSVTNFSTPALEVTAGKQKLEKDAPKLKVCRRKKQSRKDSAKCETISRNKKKSKKEQIKDGKTEENTKKVNEEKQSKVSKEVQKHKKERETSSFFTSWCFGSKIEEPTPIPDNIDNICEACKLNLNKL